MYLYGGGEGDGAAWKVFHDESLRHADAGVLSAGAGTAPEAAAHEAVLLRIREPEISGGKDPGLF